MSKFKYIVLSSGWDGTAAAYHLKQEGYDVTLGQVQDRKELKNNDPTEDPEEKKERLTQYDGMLKKVPAKELVKALLKVKNKDEYFIFCDQNSLWFYSEILLKAGFTNGLFPTKEDFEMEKDRNKAMEFVKANYPGIEMIPHTEVNGADEAIKFLEENEGIFVIQSGGDFVSTYVPQTDDAELAKNESIGQLNKHKELYNKGKVILKTKLIDPIEITPQSIFYNGKLVFTDLDIETKNIGDGANNGNQVGCGSNLIIKTDISEKLNKIAFPPIVFELAKKHTGLFAWDVSLYIHEGKVYFGEFCPNRLGYDASMTEMDMSGGAGEYFESIARGINPLKRKFGVAIRLFNLSKKCDQNVSYEGIEPHTWLYQVKEKDGQQVSVADCWDLGVLTASADTIDKAVEDLYNYEDKFSFKELYTRTRNDFLADYPTSIMNRFNAINHNWIEAPDTKAVTEIRGQLEKEYQAKLQEETSKIKKLIKSALYGGQK